ncbi:MAG TPA: tyrosine-type recombinase/integrase, partial [Streptosporangiaceae bacterium]|nr:tyrosine-type recombinase/integrase [Streptosporangiaceae bacterium]
LATGEPVSRQRVRNDMTWYSFACAYVDMKWKTAAAKYRRNIAQALAAATPPMLMAGPEQPSGQDFRSALVNWGLNTGRRASAPDDVADVLSWIDRHSRLVSELAEPALCRHVLSAATSRLDGSRAAASSVRRNRTVLLNALDYAVELRLLDDNPGRKLKWRNPAATWEVDKRSVINPAQARALLDAVRVQQPSGPRLVAFFGVLYYSGLRPEEAIALRRQDVMLPTDDNWGELHLRAAKPDVGKQWTDDGLSRDSRGLKQRAEGETRRVPCPPPLAKLLREHLADVHGGPDQLIFRGIQGGSLPTITYRRAWDRARNSAFSAQEYQSPLARRPYDLRHACLSTWLNGGVPPAQVAAWAGHSVEVLLRVYAKCLEGQDDVAKRRIAQALTAES